ncbi:MAG TPA: beta-galactosidase [Candidatus Saccharimonadales bacterium]|nr:beta-galactosidase [Candidatus Saccharimonadales bacterium]
MQKLKKRVKTLVLRARQSAGRYWRKKWWHKLLVVVCIAVLLAVGGMYGIARWYIASKSNQPLLLGTSFIPAYAESLGVDPQRTLDALLNDLGVRHFRLVSYWNQLEPEPGKYDFTLLDWQFEKIQNADAKVTLSLGLRQPRWPECHMPAWAQSMPAAEWRPHLETFIAAVVERYKHSPSLNSYQLENEYFLRGFSPHCKDFNRDRLVSEYNLVKRLDPHHPVVIARSNNALGIPLGEPTPDEFGISIYKRVWDANVTRRYLEYPFPAWFYAFVAGSQKLYTGKDMLIHELQAEAWPPNRQIISETSLDEQNKSFDAQRFADRIEFGKATGMREIYLWGSEYWYYRLIKLQDPSLWVVAQDAFASATKKH